MVDLWARSEKTPELNTKQTRDVHLSLLKALHGENGNFHIQMVIWLHIICWINRQESAFGSNGKWHPYLKIDYCHWLWSTNWIFPLEIKSRELINSGMRNSFWTARNTVYWQVLSNPLSYIGLEEKAHLSMLQVMVHQ